MPSINNIKVTGSSPLLKYFNTKGERIAFRIWYEAKASDLNLVQAEAWTRLERVFINSYNKEGEVKASTLIKDIIVLEEFLQKRDSDSWFGERQKASLKIERAEKI